MYLGKATTLDPGLRRDDVVEAACFQIVITCM
jgi:hypothetical protein